VAVDIEKARPVILLIDDVIVPDLVIEGAGFGHGSLPTVSTKVISACLAAYRSREKMP
jgi:hypothetical protein